MNVCPIGRTPALTKEERALYDTIDTEAGLRLRVLRELERRFGENTEYDINFNIGGQIGLDVQPRGWDKTFCLRFIEPGDFHTVHFFGDKTEPGGGDFELFHHSRTIGHTVTSPEDTMRQIRQLFFEAAL